VYVLFGDDFLFVEVEVEHDLPAGDVGVVGEGEVEAEEDGF
jgi:hypothetical protein